MSLRAFGKSGFVAPPFVEVRPMAHDPEGPGYRPHAPHHASGAGTLTQSGCSKATACGVHRPPRPHPVTGKGGVEKLRPLTPWFQLDDPSAKLAPDRECVRVARIRALARARETGFLTRARARALAPLRRSYPGSADEMKQRYKALRSEYLATCAELSLKMKEHNDRRDARTEEVKKHIARAKFKRDRMAGSHGPIV